MTHFEHRSHGAGQGRAVRGALAALLATATWLSAEAAARAAELQLKAQFTCTAAVVRLGDLADISGADPRQMETLSALDLFPAPAAGQKRYIDLREIQDVLLDRGVNLAAHRFSGAAQVLVTGPGGLEANPVRRGSQPDVRKATRLVREAVAHYLRQASATRDNLEPEFDLTDDQARLVDQASSPLQISGGTAPFHGTQHLQVAAGGLQGPVDFTLEVRITRPPMVAVAVRSLAKGAMVRTEDVQLISANVPVEQGTVIRSLDDVVGRETTRAIGEGHPFESDGVRSPIMIRRGDVVTIYARSSGIRVRTVARAKDDAGMGELVSVESLEDRKTFFARVSGIQEAEVYARAVQAASAAKQARGE